MIYLDNAATTLKKPDTVKSDLSKLLSRGLGNPGRGGHSEALYASELIYRSRCSIARLFGASSERVCFTSGCTDALNKAIFGLIKPCSRVLISDLEHNAVVRPINSVAGCKIKSLDLQNTDLTAIYGSNSFAFDAVICTYASNVTGDTMPIGELGRLCRKYKVPFIVDGAQGAGHYDIDIKRDCIDILCIPSHKGLYGIPGAGCMIISDEFDIQRLSPTFHGGSGSDSKSTEMPMDAPDRYEAGTLPILPIISMGLGADFVTKTCIDTIRRHEEALYSLLLSEISDIPNIKIYTSSPSSIFLFNFIGVSSFTASEDLSALGFCVRGGFHCAPLAHKKTATYETGAVRVSFSYFNTVSEIRCFAKAVKKLSVKYRKSV